MLHNHLPPSLPVPVDDGSCDHLEGMSLPSVSLPSTDGCDLNLKELEGLIVVYCYPRTGENGKAVPDGWDEIPGARGCTPQSCSFRDHSDQLSQLGVSRIYGMSTQDSDYQRELVSRLHLPFPILSDEKFELIEALNLPTFYFKDFGRLVKRLTLIIENGKIIKKFYPVFPPDKNASDVIEWLRKKYSPCHIKY